MPKAFHNPPEQLRKWAKDVGEPGMRVDVTLIALNRALAAGVASAQNVRKALPLPPASRTCKAWQGTVEKMD
jgi:hypothetical protein